MGRTFVLVHGAWHGGWCWRLVAEALRGAGHRVITPTQTGLGERRHLLRPGLTLDLFVDDIVNVLEAEELEEVVLVGHSFGGNAISGAADRVPERLRHLVYLDAMVIEGGQTPFGTMPEEVVATRRRQAAESGGLTIPCPPTAAFGIPEGHALEGWVRRRLTPHPAGTYESPLTLRHPLGNGVKRTYIACTAPVYAPLAPTQARLRGRPGWGWQEIATGHDAMVTAPEELARMLMAIG
jgi:pimeloyl-ACP methyl ester carboxylesterase